MKKMVWMTAGLILLALGCSAKPPAVVAKVAKKSELNTESWQILTPDDSCRRGVFSPNGQKALGLCEKTARHDSAQLYEFDLKEKKQRRITWQDGEISSADWIDSGRVAYTSSTDELKEIPFLPKKPAAGDLPGDIYRSDLVGDDIVRLTERSGYDGDLSIHPKTKEILFVARASLDHQLMKIGSNGKAGVLLKGGKEERLFPVALLDGTLAWLEKKPADALWHLSTNNRKAPVRWKDRALKSLRLAPGGKAWIVVEASETTPSKVWLVGLGETCEKILFETKIGISFADAASNPARLLLTATDGDHHRLTVKDLGTEDFQCPSLVKTPAPTGPTTN